MEQQRRRGRKPKENKYECLPGYTEKQSKVIRGEINPESVDGRLARYLLESAINLKDAPTIAFAQKLLDTSRERARLNNCKRACKRSRDLKSGAITWKQPKSNEYSEHQRQVIRGEIPIEAVDTKELIHIHLKAKEQCDIELSERVLSIIIDRRNASIEKQLAKTPLRLALLHNDMNDPKCYLQRHSLINWERDVLNSVVDLSECTIEHLIHILHVCESHNDVHGAKMAKLLLDIKEHPETIYPTQDPAIALNMIEQMIGKPIRRPDTWFKR